MGQTSKQRPQREIVDDAGRVVATYATEADAIGAAARLPEGYTARRARR